MPKTPKILERYFKGVSSYRRIQILLLIDKEGPLALFDITEKLKTNIKTTSEHTSRLVKAGLLNKQYKSQYVLHSLSPYGEKFVKFMRSFD